MQSTPEPTTHSECAVLPRAPPLGGSYILGPRSAPIAALSGSNSKAPGFAGGYLLKSLLVLYLFQTLATFGRDQAFGTQH